MVKPAFQIGYVPLIDRHGDKLSKADSCQSIYTNFWQLEYTFEFDKLKDQDNQYLLRQHILLTRFFDRPDSPYTTAQSSENIKKNGIPTLNQIRRLLVKDGADANTVDSGFAVSSPTTMSKDSKLFAFAEKCRWWGVGHTTQTYWIPVSFFKFLLISL